MTTLLRLPATTLVAAGLICVVIVSVGNAQEIPASRAGARWEESGRRTPVANSAALRRLAIRQKLQMRSSRAALATPLGVGSGWVSLGPLPLPSDASGIGLQDYGWVSGRVTSVAIDPNDSSGNTVYAGGAYGGIWRSTNAGPLSQNPASVTWIPLTDGQATLAIGAIAIQPQKTNPDPSRSVILAGTGESDSSEDSYYGLGILRSADAGQSWSLVSQDASGLHSFAGLSFSRIAFSAANPNLAVAAAASSSEGILEGLENPLSVNRGLYFSTDAGTSWNYATLTDAGVGITPSSATSVVYNAAAGKFFAAVRFHGFYVSVDGVNWARLSSQPGGGLSPAACPAQGTQTSCPIYRGEIAVVPNRAGPAGLGEMYAWYVDANDANQGIWKSLDGGGSWSQINDSGIVNCGDLLGGCGTAQGAYNMALAAVPNGTATDLYAGAVNIYKCTMTNALPSCNGSGNNSFVNLTHVYGCSDIARVHPAQHAMDSLVTNGAALMFFANDGGIYRALDGFTGLTNSTCGSTNQFDSLNATLGPLAQFVSLAESATDPNLMFGGTQGNGAPATAFSQTGAQWINVNAGDNGLTAVNPANDNEWFVASPPDAISGVNLFRCANGVSCHTQDFQNGQVASSNTLGGDSGPFHLPFLLDRRNPSSLFIGTCRVWRGASTGGSFFPLSPDFETGGTGACTGGETNLVRSLAAGGPVDAGGNSQVIYAGTNGFGPSISTSPTGGHIWITQNANGGPNTWVDRTGAINRMGFPVSAIALDPADATGQTAYITIMGFHTPHVWKTANAGVTWTDFTANLPDAPVNAIVLDPGSSTSNGTMYIGTDVGVFATSTGAASWTEVGPSAAQAGFLPNVAVTSLALFSGSGLKRLRAATYGRGIWEWNLVTTPDFQIWISNNPQTAFAGTTAAFNGVMWARNGYASNVNLSCAPGVTSPPQSCSITPSAVSPVSAGSPFTLNAGGTAGDYTFNLHAVGSDASAVTHDFSVTLHIVDFSLGTPQPNAISVSPGGTGGPVLLQVSALGGFRGAVSLACSGLPSGASCVFQPSSTVSPTAASSASVTLNVNTSLSTPTGTSQLTISATAAGGPVKSQTLGLTVSAAPDYRLAITNPSLSAQAGTPAVFNGTVSAVNGYNNTVTLSCGAGAPPGCIANPASMAPAGGFTVTVSSGVAQAYSFNIQAVGSDPASTAHSVPVTFTALPNQGFDFTLNATPPSVSTSAGQAATYSINVAPVSGTFPSNVTFACSGLPLLTTCGFNPAQIAAGSGSSAVTLTLTTTSPSAAGFAAMQSSGLLPGRSPASSTLFSSHTYPVALCLAVLFLMASGFLRGEQRHWRKGAGILFLALCSVSCGGGLQGNSGGGGSGNPGTPKGTYSVKITATSGSVTHSATVGLTVTN